MSAKAVNNFDIVIVPQEVTIRILAGLNAESLAVVNLVCKHWNQLTKQEALLAQLDLKILFKRVSFIDEPVWKTHVSLTKFRLSFVGNAKNICDIIRALQRCLSWPIEKINKIKPGITLVDIPKGLSINKLRVIAPQLFAWVSPKIIKDHGAIEVDGAYTIIIADHIMVKTRMKDEQRQLIEIEKHKGARPKAIEAIALLIMTYLISQKKLLDETYTRCEEQVVIKADPDQTPRSEVNASYQVGVGFAAQGIYVSYFDSDNHNIGLSTKHQF